MKKIYKAHINDNTNTIQTVKEHSENTACRCRQFAVPTLKDLLYITGLLHDIGKYQDSFQQRIDGKNIAVEHSTCGALIADKMYPGAMGLMMEYCIAGHHSGIPDGGFTNDTPDMPTLNGRMKREFEDFFAYKEELDIPQADQKCFLEFLSKDCNKDIDKLIDKFAFLTRYVFSCLTDADSLDTAEFCRNLPDKHLKTNFNKCLEKVVTNFSSFSCKTQLQKNRSILQKQVFDKESTDAEIYLMNMPTGSGKTLCSVKFALERAIKRKKKRIIYIIPYNSIIDQTASVFSRLFGSDAGILRHQSTYSYAGDEFSEDYRLLIKSASENWDAEFIITTAVQFFESIYSNKRSKLRKLHNMADSILVFDEAHLMPQKYLQPCLQAITYITRYLDSEAVFLTATMPDFPKLIKKYALQDSKIINLVDDTLLFDSFYKCQYSFLDNVSEDRILEMALQYPASLVIVNTRAKAAKFYKKAKGRKYHLSTYMTPYDRKRVLDMIKDELAGLERDYPDMSCVPEERKVFIVSTSLIEAGVDLDVYTVFRELAGLDSILQAGGRCNREGKREKGEVFIFSTDEKYISQNARANITKGLLKKYKDISCPQSIKEYYDRLFFLNEDEIANNAISSKCTDIRSIPFKEYADSFEIIDSKTVPVVVERNEESREIIKGLKYAELDNIRKLQQYSCTVYQKELDDLITQKVIDDFGTGIWCLTNKDYYDENIGITFQAKDYFL